MNSNDPLLYNAIKEKDRSKDAERLVLGLRCCGAAGEGVSKFIVNSKCGLSEIMCL